MPEAIFPLVLHIVIIPLGTQITNGIQKEIMEGLAVVHMLESTGGPSFVLLMNLSDLRKKLFNSSVPRPAGNMA
jgi:hypothetical protein